jgi:hypothetical protein
MKISRIIMMIFGAVVEKGHHLLKDSIILYLQKKRKKSWCIYFFKAEEGFSMTFFSSSFPYSFVKESYSNLGREDSFIKTVDLHLLQLAQYGFVPLYFQTFLHLLHFSNFKYAYYIPIYSYVLISIYVIYRIP